MKRLCRKRILIPLFSAGLLFLLLKFVFLLGYVPSDSMEPSLSSGSYILGCRIYGELERGDIIIFRHDGQTLVKRIAGLPGDTAAVHIDASDFSDEELQKVPEHCYYVLGDNAEDSYDSRYWDDPFIRNVDILAVLWLPCI
ncbi:MAG: signal peptidase I [Oscillospiraceae bacterium]